MKQILLLNILCLMSLCLSAQTYQTKRDISEFQFHHRCYGADIYDCEQ